MGFAKWFCAREQGAQRLGKRTLFFKTLVFMAIAGVCGTVDVLAQTPGFKDFTSVANLTLNGNAHAPFNNGSVNVLRLNPAQTSQVGSAWFSAKQPIAAGFTSVFQFQITNSNAEVPPAPFPADGLAFVIQNAPITIEPAGGGTASIGGGGGQIGYETIPNSLAIEFDTFYNQPNGDPDANHVGVQSCGIGPNSANHNATYIAGFVNEVPQVKPCKLGLVSPAVTLSDGQVHTVIVTYEFLPAGCVEGCTPELFVKLDGTDLFPGGINVDLSALLSLDNGTAWVGFTGATGALIENNDILSWNFSPTITKPAPAGVFTPFTFGTYLYKVKPNQSIDALTVKAVLTDPVQFAKDRNQLNDFPNSTCIVYDNTGGQCVEFHADCSSPSNSACGNVSYDVVTSYDVPKGSPPIVNPGFLKATGQQCMPGIAFDANIITQFIQTRIDPTTKGSSRPSFSCFAAVQNVTYPPANLDILNLAAAKVKPNANLTYVATVGNFGPSGAQGVAISNPIPSGTTYVSSALCTLASGCSNSTCSFDGTVASCQVGNLDKFGLEFMVTTVKVTAPVGTVLSDTATVTSFNPDPDSVLDRSWTAKTLVSTGDR